MLQQTQANRVAIRFKALIKQYPSIVQLAQATNKEILTLWSGLGYNRRALYLVQSAKIILHQYKGKIPSELSELIQLPGVGVYTAGAIRAFGCNLWGIFLETNIRTVLIHHLFQKSRNKISDQILSQHLVAINHIVQKQLPSARTWYSHLMDYGAELKSQGVQINNQTKNYIKQKPFQGSNRQMRGAIIRALTNNHTLSQTNLHSILNAKSKLHQSKIAYCLAALTREGMISARRDRYRIL
ncbi:MAG: hypothetical protein QM538_03620 [Methylacidiphilales bacterium]|nr:hypothetical protein [Candidatus Methylacidiphilales bacterium]